MDFPLPGVDKILNGLIGAKFFRTIDLNQGHNPLKMDESGIQYTSFLKMNEQYEFPKMASGLKNVPRTFQRAIPKIFEILNV